MYLFILILFMALIDMIGIASILPFIALLTNPEVINTNNILNFLYKKVSVYGVTNDQDFLILVGILVFFFVNYINSNQSYHIIFSIKIC